MADEVQSDHVPIWPTVDKRPDQASSFLPNGTDDIVEEQFKEFLEE